LVIAFAVIVGHEFVKGPAEVPFPDGIIWSRHSSLIDRTNRYAKALQFGARNGVRTSRTPETSRNCRTGVTGLSSSPLLMVEIVGFILFTIASFIGALAALKKDTT
jgi:hypothetical protein